MRVLHRRVNNLNNFDQQGYIQSILSQEIQCIKPSNDFFYRASSIGNQYKFITCSQWHEDTYFYAIDGELEDISIIQLRKDKGHI